MLKTEELAEVREVATAALDNAEAIWHDVGHEFRIINAREEIQAKHFSEALETQIPGYQFLADTDPKVDDFISIVADMRGSTKHLLEAISSKKSKVSQLQRVFYETSALLPSLAKSISLKHGNVTEYLGDGVLGLFQASEDQIPNAIYDAYDASMKCFAAVTQVVNPLLQERYDLPALAIGIGLSFSKAVITIVGLPNHRVAKVFGHCVYYASKLSGGNNQLYIDESLRHKWPRTKGGSLTFAPRSLNGVTGYLVDSS